MDRIMVMATPTVDAASKKVGDTKIETGNRFSWIYYIAASPSAANKNKKTDDKASECEKRIVV